MKIAFVYSLAVGLWAALVSVNISNIQLNAIFCDEEISILKKQKLPQLKSNGEQ